VVELDGMIEAKEDNEVGEEGMGKKGGDGWKYRAYEGDGGSNEEFAHFVFPSNENGSVNCVFFDISIWQKQLANSIKLKKFEFQKIQSRMCFL
jgi:hypothetical protein